MEAEDSPPKEDRDEKMEVLHGALRKLERLRRRDLFISVAVSIAISLAFTWWAAPSTLQNLWGFTVQLTNNTLLPVLQVPSQLLQKVSFLSGAVKFLDGLTVGFGGALIITAIAVTMVVSIHVLRVRSHTKTAVSAPATSNEARTVGVESTSKENPVEEKHSQTQRKKPDRGRLHFLGVDPEVTPAIGRKLKRGIYATDRIHTFVVGFPNSGKTRFLLSLIKQHIDNDEGFMVLDSHRDLAPLVLSHIPPEKWGRVVYINPWTAFEDKFNHRVAQINFLEYKDPRDRDVTARLFMDSMEKLQEKFWGPRLDMIMMNGLYLLMEKESAKLPNLYKVIANEDYRETLLLNCKDANVKTFWEHEYKTMPKEAHNAVLTKVYRLVQERIVVPMFMAERSTVDFKRAMDQGKFVVIDLPEGRVTTDIANFIGSLILARVYMAGMGREDTPEAERALQGLRDLGKPVPATVPRGRPESHPTNV